MQKIIIYYWIVSLVLCHTNIKHSNYDGAYQYSIPCEENHSNGYCYDITYQEDYRDGRTYQYNNDYRYHYDNENLCEPPASCKNDFSHEVVDEKNNRLESTYIYPYNYETTENYSSELGNSDNQEEQNNTDVIQEQTNNIGIIEQPQTTGANYRIEYKVEDRIQNNKESQEVIGEEIEGKRGIENKVDSEEKQQTEDKTDVEEEKEIENKADSKEEQEIESKANGEEEQEIESKADEEREQEIESKADGEEEQETESEANGEEEQEIENKVDGEREQEIEGEQQSSIEDNQKDKELAPIEKEEWDKGGILQKNEVIDGDFYLKSGKLDLNGHVLEITGDFYHFAGRVKINGGMLVVDGNYYMNHSNNGGQSSGILELEQSQDCVVIKGNISLNSSWGMKSWNAGKIYLSGNFEGGTLVEQQSLKVEAGSKVEIILNGESDQTIEIQCMQVTLPNIRIEGRANRTIGVSIITQQIAPKPMIIESISNVIPIKIVMNGPIRVEKLDIYGNIEMVGECKTTNIELNGYELCISGNLVLYNQLNFSGGSLAIQGSMKMETVCGINMTRPTEQLVIQKDLVIDALWKRIYLEAGELIVGGNIIQTNSRGLFETSNKLQVILLATTDELIAVKGKNLALHCVILKKTQENYCFDPAVIYEIKEE